MKTKIPTILLIFMLAISPYAHAAKETRYIDDIPVTGQSTSFNQIDEKIVAFMNLHQIKAASVAVMVDGEIVLSHGYGYSDRTRQVPVEPDTLMRIASITKPFTAAAIKALIRGGKLSTDTKILDVLAIQPFHGKLVDPRWHDITVGHLLAHKGGWDRNATDIEFDPMFRVKEIQREMRLAGLPDQRQIIAYMMSRPLDFNPGEKYAYSNFGYSILGRVIEKVTGMSYIEYLRQSVLVPAQITNTEIGRTLPKDRNSKEIQSYYHPGKASSLFEAKSVPSPDGGFYLEVMDSHGGLISSAESLVKFAQNYWVTGEPRQKGQKGTGIHTGALDGTLSFLWWRADGINVAIIFNQRVGDIDYYPGMRGRDMNNLYSPIRMIVDRSIDELISAR